MHRGLLGSLWGTLTVHVLFMYIQNIIEINHFFGVNLGIPATVVYGQQCILYSGSVGSQLRWHQQQRPLQGFAEDHMG